MTFRFIDVEKHNHKVARLCRVLRVSRSGYYAWAGRGLSDRAASDIALAAQITAIHTESDGTYGTPRIFRELRAMGIRVSRRRVGRLMRELVVASNRRRGAPNEPLKPGETNVTVVAVELSGCLPGGDSVRCVGRAGGHTQRRA